MPKFKNKIFINFLLSDRHLKPFLLELAFKKIELKQYFKKAIDFVLTEEKITKKELSLSLTDDKFIKSLNKQYRHKDKATDVLAFNQKDDILLGDVFISLVTAKFNASFFAKDFLKELTLLTIHGTLHLLSYDHIKEDEAFIMEKKQEYFLDRILIS